MHTTTVLCSTDFQYWQTNTNREVQIDFPIFCPGYHIQDRVGVVSPSLETGVLHTGYAILALATAFYDVLRARSQDFFDYPHHFAFLNATREGFQTQKGRLRLDPATACGPWSALDVWPGSQWIRTPGSAGAMLKRAFDWQINRLFWPEDYLPGADDISLPAHVQRLLRARLRSVYYYNASQPNLAIHATQPVEDMVQRSLSRLPAGVDTALKARQQTTSAATTFPYVECYRRVSVEAFLTAMAPCFAEEVPTV